MRTYRAKQAGKIVPVDPGDIDAALGITSSASAILATEIVRAELAAERDALLDEVKRLKDVLTERDILLEAREAQIARQAQSPELAKAFKAVRPDMTRGTVTADGTKGMTRGPLSGIATDDTWGQFRPAPKSVAEPKPKRRR